MPLRKVWDSRVLTGGTKGRKEPSCPPDARRRPTPTQPRSLRARCLLPAAPRPRTLSHLRPRTARVSATAVPTAVSCPVQHSWEDLLTGLDSGCDKDHVWLPSGSLSLEREQVTLSPVAGRVELFRLAGPRAAPCAVGRRRWPVPGAANPPGPRAASAVWAGPGSRCPRGEAPGCSAAPSARSPPRRRDTPIALNRALCLQGCLPCAAPAWCPWPCPRPP